MKTLLSRLSLGAIGLTVAALAGCAATAGHPRSPHIAAAPAGGPGQMDMEAMCDMHRQMMSKPMAERQAMMQEHMKSMSMSADAMQKHMQDMQERCK